jgi:hypothetical protein
MRHSFVFALVLLVFWVVPCCSKAGREQTVSATETYKPRDLIETQYGEKENEFGFEDYDGEYLGALFFTVGTDGDVYIYDGVKGNIKLYANNGTFVKTIKAVPWQVGVLFPQDMTLTPNGDIYILCEIPDPEHRYELFLTGPGSDTVKSVPIAVPWSFCRDETGYRVYSAAELVSDQHGDIYLKDNLKWKSLKLVAKGKPMSASAQSSSLQEGVVTWSGRVLSYVPRRSKTDSERKLMLLDETGGLVKDMSDLRGHPLGTDSSGNVYLGSLESVENAPFVRMAKYSPDGSLLAVVNFPRSRRLTMTYGKGSRIVGIDGSIYEMIGARESVKVRKWEHVR